MLGCATQLTYLPRPPYLPARRPPLWRGGPLAMFISLGRPFRLIGTHNQFFIPRNQVSHIRIGFALAFLRNCKHALLSPTLHSS